MIARSTETDHAWFPVRSTGSSLQLTVVTGSMTKFDAELKGRRGGEIDRIKREDINAKPESS